MQNLVLAQHKSVPFVSSTRFAEGLRANPTLVRKLLTTLVQRGLLESQLGRNGGVRLARPPERITLRDIYEAATAGSKKMWAARLDLPQRCIVSTFFEPFFQDLSEEVDAAILSVLNKRTLADSFNTLADLERKALAMPEFRRPYEEWLGRSDNPPLLIVEL